MICNGQIMLNLRNEGEHGMIILKLLSMTDGEGNLLHLWEGGGINDQPWDLWQCTQMFLNTLREVIHERITRGGK